VNGRAFMPLRARALRVAAEGLRRAPGDEETHEPLALTRKSLKGHRSPKVTTQSVRLSGDSGRHSESLATGRSRLQRCARSVREAARRLHPRAALWRSVGEFVDANEAAIDGALDGRRATRPESSSLTSPSAVCSGCGWPRGAGPRR